MRSTAFRLAAAALAWLAVDAVAQNSSADDDGPALERITVTGTRLVGPPLDGAYPITIIGREELENSGRATLGEYLQDLPFMSGSPIGTSVNERGSGGGFSRGIETVELRGLGAQRTLVLVNGRRMIAGGSGASGLVDLALIPVTMVDRVEILKTGASVEYGADAVAGVVNIITRRDFEGLALNARGSLTDRGDGETLNAGAVYGRRFQRGQFVAGLTYFEQAAVGKGERDFATRLLTVDGPDNDIVPDGSSAPPGGNFRTSLGRLTLIEGRDGDSPDDFRPFINGGPGTDRFNFNPFEDLVQDSERLSVFAAGQLDVSPTLELFVEAAWQQRDSDTQIAPLPFFTTREEGVEVSADNLFNPFAERLTDARRRFIEAGPRRFVQDTETWRAVVGAQGLFGSWLWDTSLTRARHTIEQFQTGDILDDRTALALGPSFIDSSGEAVCGTPAQPIPGCVPLNLFGGPGSISDEMLDYVGTDLRDSGFNEQTVFDVNLGGDVVQLPAGPLAAAFGYSYRDESGADVPDPQTVAGNTSGAARAVTRGSFDSHELYAEFGAPLLRDAPWAKSLNLDLGVRGVDYSNFDTRTVFEVGLHYQPVDNVTVRAAWSEAFRAPNIRELFGGQSQSNPAVEDPCADFSRLSDVEIQRCIDQGVPGDGSFGQTGNETPQLGGGNPALEPEDAEVFTAGITWEPRRVTGLALNLDYYDITIDDSIGSLGANTILDQCLATGSEQFCGRIDRDTDGTIRRVRSELQNIATETARGLDLGVRFGHDLAGGRLQHHALVSYVAERDLVAFPGAEPFAGAGGFDPDSFGAIPEWKGNYRAVWQGRRLELGYGLDWIGAITESGGEVFPGTVNRAGSVVYHDLRAGWRFGESLRVRAGIENLTDVQPPFLANGPVANTDVGTYRLLGRTYWLRLDLRY